MLSSLGVGGRRVGYVEQRPVSLSAPGQGAPLQVCAWLWAAFLAGSAVQASLCVGKLTVHGEEHGPMLQRYPFRVAGGFWRSTWGILVVLGSWQPLGRGPVGGSSLSCALSPVPWSLPGALWKPRLLPFTPPIRPRVLQAPGSRQAAPPEVSTCVM